MRGTFIAMCTVLVCSLALCLFSLFFQHRSLETMDNLRMEAIELVDAKDKDGAIEKTVELANLFKEKLKIIELLASHNDLHDAYLHIVAAQVSLELGDLDDTYQELALLGETLGHLQNHEAFTIENLY